MTGEPKGVERVFDFLGAGLGAIIGTLSGIATAALLHCKSWGQVLQSNKSPTIFTHGKTNPPKLSPSQLDQQFF